MLKNSNTNEAIKVELAALLAAREAVARQYEENATKVFDGVAKEYLKLAAMTRSGGFDLSSEVQSAYHGAMVMHESLLAGGYLNGDKVDKLESQVREAEKKVEAYRASLHVINKMCDEKFPNGIVDHEIGTAKWGADLKMHVLDTLNGTHAGGNITGLVEKAVADYKALSPEQKTAHDKAQQDNFVRGITTPCEHGVLDFETCPECREDHIGAGFRQHDIDRGLILFRKSNNAHDSINFVALTSKIDKLSDDAKRNLVSLMRSYADSIDPDVVLPVEGF